MPKKLNTGQQPATPLIADPGVAGRSIPGGSQALADKALWSPNNGFQMNALFRNEFEVLLAGEKGSGKTSITQFWLTKGNWNKLPVDGYKWALPPNPTATDVSYIYHPGYTALVVRRTQPELTAYIREGMEVWKHYGGVDKVDPLRVEFPLYDKITGKLIDANKVGATFWFGHLSDENSWLRYVGIARTRVVVEEAIQLPEINLFMKLRSCVRSPYPEMKEQIYLTTNWLGPGVMWLDDRYCKGLRSGKNSVVRVVTGYEKSAGKLEPVLRTVEAEGEDLVPGTIIHETIKDENTDEVYVSDRVYLHGCLKDNPIQNTARYRATLISGTDQEVAAYYYGRRDAATGSFFRSFRSKRMLDLEGNPMEAENALHVLNGDQQRAKLHSWYRRAVGADYGFNHNAAFVLGIMEEPISRLHCAEEFSAPGFGLDDFGISIGQAIERAGLDDLEYAVPVFLSHDCFHNTNDGPTEADHIANGIRKIIGEHRVLMRPDIFAEGQAPTSLDEAHVVVVRGYNKRVAGWRHMQELLRWKADLVEADVAGFSMTEAQRILLDRGETAFNEYLSHWQRVMPTTRPQMILWDNVRKLAKAIQQAQHDENDPEDVRKKHWEGADILEACRYLAMGINIISRATEPTMVKLTREIEQARARGASPTTLHMMAAAAARKMEQRTATRNFIPIVPGSRRSRALWNKHVQNTVN